MILTFLNSVLPKSTYFGRNKIFLLALEIYYLQKRDALHQRNYFFNFFAFLLSKFLRYLLKGSEHFYQKKCQIVP